MFRPCLVAAHSARIIFLLYLPKLLILFLFQSYHTPVTCYGGMAVNEWHVIQRLIERCHVFIVNIRHLSMTSSAGNEIAT